MNEESAIGDDGERQVEELQKIVFNGMLTGIGNNLTKLTDIRKDKQQLQHFNKSGLFFMMIFGLRLFLCPNIWLNKEKKEKTNSPQKVLLASKPIYRTCNIPSQGNV
uniref:Uncharacterized protein n=1 Tax=Glossina palpalis gambiensis TaxID=67801 RepID=A0A1B0BPL3_9MUSC